jgi:putative hydrolase of the HAD superfamily
VPGPDTPAGTRLRGVLTDWGGVLTNPIAETVAAWLEADGIEKKGYMAVVMPWVGEAYDDPAAEPDGAAVAVNPIHALERGECTREEFERLLAARITRTDGSPVPAAGLLDRMFAAAVEVEAMFELFRGLRRTGVRTGLLSNSWGNEYPRHLFAEMFDTVIISGEVGMRKPEERIFRHALAELGLEPAECAFVDDIEANIAAAEALGMVGVHHRDPDTTASAVKQLFGLT